MAAGGAFESKSCVKYAKTSKAQIKNIYIAFSFLTINIMDKTFVIVA